MCHHSRMSLSPRLQCRQELLLMLTVQRTRRFVQKKDRGIAITPNAASDLPTPPFPLLPDRNESIGHLVAKSKHNASSNSPSVSVLSTPSWRLHRMVPANITGSWLTASNRPRYQSRFSDSMRLLRKSSCNYGNTLDIMSSTLHPIIPLSLLVNIDTVKPMEQVCLTLVPMNPSMSTTFYFYSHRIQFCSYSIVV